MINSKQSILFISYFCLYVYLYIDFFLLINAARTNLDYHSQNYENIVKALGHYPPLSKADAATGPGSMCGGDNLKFMWKADHYKC